MQADIGKLEELLSELEAIEFFDRDFAMCLLAGEDSGPNDHMACASRYLRKCEIHDMLQKMTGHGRA
ncbi:MAG TPA: hypothetical protein VFA89_00065 [Terriglobales bacterium]|nr:hypothetical protein [Terriglobales bacterium]